ncbi:flagellar hook protein FlgE [Oceanimonas smirnovii]|uniref:Flagellar hook protein FlgE n=1 Tax=Oceanimonas smirnovii TaxID=264574 RepID=A0ABW7P4M4_9GAMM
MSFNIALSGVNAAQKDLDVTANNIANVNTIGFKESRAEFADVYANSIFANAKTQTGSGVQTAAVAQQFHQGALLNTNNSLDMAINGNGFFMLADGSGSLERSFTRAGAFKLNDQGFVVNSQGSYLQVFNVNADGTPVSLAANSTKSLKIPEKAGVPQQTGVVNGEMNLPANATPLDPNNFDASDSSTYSSSTSVTIYDSLGEPHTLTKYFVKDNSVAGSNTWQMHAYVDGNDVLASPMTLTFDTNGTISTPVPTEITTTALGFNNGSDPSQELNIKFDSVTQFASPFEVSALTQDGATVGRLTKVDIGPDGTVEATYSNGKTERLGIIAMARFPNDQGLTQIGDTQWRESLLSGEAVVGQPNSGTLGKINSSNLEQSNTNLTTELVDLITAQRNFQANSRALEVNSTLQQTILQIR